MTKDEALKLALETLECWQRNEDCNEPMSKILEAIKKVLAQPEITTGNILMDSYNAMQSMKVEGPRHVVCQCDKCKAQPEQEPVAYDKTEMNCFVQDLYDKKMKEGKHGHYETMFHVVHQAIKIKDSGLVRCTHPVKDLEDIAINITWNENSMRDFGKDELNFARAILRKAQEK